MRISELLRSWALRWLYRCTKASDGTLEEYICIVKNTHDKSEFAPLSIGSTEHLREAEPDTMFIYLPKYKKLLKKYPIPEAKNENTDFGKARAVMEWLTRNTYYNGNQIKRMPDDALFILDWSVGKGFEGAINCRHKAIVFTDMLIARGIKAYPIALVSGEAERRSCHLVTHVYCREHGWIVMDPSLGSWFTDETGKILSIYELRDSFLRGEQPILHNYSFNGTGECRDIYLKDFIEVTLTNISTWTANSLERGLRSASEVDFTAKVPENCMFGAHITLPIKE